MSTTAEGLLPLARDAVQRHAWREAFDLLRRADASGVLGADDYDSLAEAAWWIGALNDAIEARERAHAAYMAAGDKASAGRQAMLLGTYHEHKLDHPISMGWRKRAERLLADLPESPHHGLLYRLRAGQAMSRGDYEVALSWAERTRALGKRFEDPNLEALGLHDRGRILIAKGDVDEGLALLDEAMASAVGGELDPYPTAIIYCNVIVACQDLTDYGRAADWTEAAKRWCERQSISGFPGMCRVRRAEVVRLRGAWAEAEHEARKACAELQEFYLDYAAEGFYQVGEIRLRMGDYSGAEDAFRQAHEMGRSPQPGLALLRLGQGELDAAERLIHGALTESRDRLGRAKLLPAAVEIALATGRRDHAKDAVAELQAIAEAFRTPGLRATALTAAGTSETQSGDHETAIGTLSRALRHWQEIDAPYESARTRMFLADALRQHGDVDAAALETRSAKATFDRLGAVPDSRAAANLLGEGAVETSARASTTLTRTLMFTDIVRSTALVEAIGDDAWENVVRWHDQKLRALFAEHGGEEVDHAGDGFFVAFRTASAAVECAVAIQRTLEAHRRDHGYAPALRIGLHSAPAASTARGYRGRGVHVAARIAALAEAGEILVSTDTLREQVGTYRASQPRDVTLRGVSQPVTVGALEWR
jgi:class 3 adenylate cyclase